MTFDPYHKWLGILPEEQPPNHYRLLGIVDFESDEDDLFEDLELVDDLFSDDNIWFNEEKIRIVTEIHKFLENKKEIGKVQSIYSLIDIANQINIVNNGCPHFVT